MTTSKKIMIGLGVAGGALLAAWLLTGERGKKTKAFVSKKTDDVKRTFNRKQANTEVEEPDIHYV